MASLLCVFKLSVSPILQAICLQKNVFVFGLALLNNIYSFILPVLLYLHLFLINMICISWILISQRYTKQYKRTYLVEVKAKKKKKTDATETYCTKFQQKKKVTKRNLHNTLIQKLQCTRLLISFSGCFFLTPELFAPLSSSYHWNSFTPQFSSTISMFLFIASVQFSVLYRIGKCCVRGRGAESAVLECELIRIL